MTAQEWWLDFAVKTVIVLTIVWLLTSLQRERRLREHQQGQIKALLHMVDRLRVDLDRTDRTFRTWAGIVAKPKPERKRLPQDASGEAWEAQQKYAGRGSVTINQTTPKSERPLPRPPGWRGW